MLASRLTSSSRLVACFKTVVFGAVMALVGAGAKAQTGDVVVSASTAWPAGTYSLTSLTVQGGAVLSIGGGSTVTVANGISVSGSSSIVLQGANTTAQVNGAWVGVGSTLQAGSVRVDAGSSINADGQGYAQNKGPGGSTYSGGGGSYGGIGGNNNSDPTLIYGSAAMPVDLGSGSYGAGGGAIRLIVSGTLTINGTISANGANVVPGGGGAGSGGSVYVTTGSLTGGGTFTANGGSNTAPALSGAPSGGGGRLAVYYGSASGFSNFATSTASGGQFTGTSAGYTGTNGTSVFVNTSGTNGSLAVYQAFSIPANSVLSYDSIAVQNGAVLSIGGGSTITVANGVAVTGNSSIVMQGANATGKVNGVYAGVGVTLKAASLQVDAGSSISADKQGYLSSARRAEDGGASGGSGGSYGGLGGYYPGPIYGSAAMPMDLGSGGAGAQYYGSNGGGAIRLIISGLLLNNGTISANGEAVLPSQGGAGAGGSVYVTTATLAGSGTFTANGGSNTTPTLSGAAAGGGGRVAVYYSGPTSFSGFNASTATGGVYTGAQTGYAGTNGTVAFFDTSVTGSNVSVYQSGFQLPANTTVQYNSLTIANGSAVTIGNGSTISVATSLNVGGGSVLTVGGGTTLSVTNGIVVTGNSNIVLQSANNSAKVSGGWAGVGVTIQAGSVQVDAGSTINADGQGYVTGAGPGDGPSAYGGSGGSYGGLGGYYNAGPAYGSAVAPVDLGSGGLGAQYGGSNGGGAIRLIVSGILTNNGTISANGQAALFCTYGGCGGAGAGGSVYVTTAALAGAGSFTANGGSNTIPTNNGSAAGGGGRVAVYYAGPTSFTGFTTSTASGGIYTGTATGYAGSDGTAAFFDTSSPNGNVNVYQHFEIPVNGSAQYNALTVNNGASVTMGGGSQLSVKQALRVTGTITALATNLAVRNNGTWGGRGVIIAAGSMQIDASGTINADAQGYPTNTGPGFGSYTTGGSYGGQGGGQTTASIYGSTSAPIDLGSGGGGGQNTGGGAGGGAIEILVAGTLTNNGAISANGQSIATSGYGGAGSGGSVYVQTNTLAGTGTFAANGGSNTLPNNAGSGGGGGRISINYITNSGVSRSALSVNPGTGANVGTVGTVNFAQLAALQFLQPSSVAVHGVTTVQWFSDNGVSTTVNVAGPQSSVIATSGIGVSSATWNTTAIPDGAYELRLTSVDASGAVVGTVSKSVVVNNSVTWVSGTLTADTHWTANHVYVIEGDLIIPSGITLTIDPGTVVKSLPNFQIIVQSGGTLTALGGDTATPVIFTTFDDATAGGNTSFGNGVPQPGEWGGIGVNTGGTFNTNTNTFIRYGHGVLTSSITSNTTLFSSQVYEISGELVVTSGSSLTVQPGTVIKFDAGAGITVNAGGALFANGTLAQPIYFTSINDQSVGANLISQANPNAALTAPAPGDWNNIQINGTATLNFVHVLYGGGPIPTVAQTGMLAVGGGATTVTLSNSTLAYSYYIGIEVDAGTLAVSNSIFYGNQDRAINNFGTVHIVNSTFDSNAAGPFNHGGAMDMANSAVTGFTNTQFGGVGGGITPFENNDVFTATPNVPRYIDMSDLTGTDGNISAAPVYMNGPQHDYRPTYGSPLIDAGNGTVANYPATDAFNDPRYNAPLVTAKKGVADASGKYPDIGAFEFVQSAPSDLDLTASAVQGPSSAVVGAQVQIKWTVTNVGVGTVYGPWHDAVYLVRNPGTSPVETYAGEVLSGQGVVLGPGATYSGTATVTVPGATVGEYSWEVKTNVRGEVFEGANTANNKAISLNPVQVDVPALTAGAGPISGSFTAAGQAVYYKVIPSATQTTNVQLALVPPATGSVQLFVGAGYVPTPQHYDYQQVEFNSTTASVVIPAGVAQTYYVTANPQVLTTAPAPFTITATAVSFSLTSVSPNRVPAVGEATLTFVGGGFTSNTVFKLVSSTGAVYTATSVFLSDSSNAQATFTVSQFPSDQYTAEAVDGATVTLANAVYITQYSQVSNLSSGGVLQTFLRVPQAFRLGFPSLVTLEYTNISGSDLAAPMVAISSQMKLAEVAPQCDGCSPNLPAQYGNSYTSGLVLAVNQSGAAGVLPAGASGSISFLATAPNLQTGQTLDVSTEALDPISSGYVPDCALFPDRTPPFSCAFRVEKTGAYTTAADFCASLTPPGSSAAAYTRACMLLFNKAGFSYLTSTVPVTAFNYSSVSPVTTGNLLFSGFNKVLANDATVLSSAGSYEYDVSRLLAYEFQNDGIKDFSVRYHQGAYGYGASHPFDISLSVAAGAPVVTYPDGSTRSFVTPSPTLANTYLGPVGDYGTITMQTDTSWLLTEPTGTVYHFLANVGVNPLDYVQDRAGNRTTLTYTGTLVTQVTDAFGNTASMQYDGGGHIVSYTSPSGRVTTYTYTTLADTQKSTFLTSVTDVSGTTTLTWNQGGSHGVGYIDDSCVKTYCEPAIGIASVAYPDGTHTYYTYDAAGRLTGSSRDGGAQAVTYTYNSNPSFINGNDSTTVTDATGKATTTFTNVSGLPTSIADPLGKIVLFRYNAEDKLQTSIGPLGDSTSNSYDTKGNLLSATSATGNTTSFEYGPQQNLLSIADANGNALAFSYDSNFNTTAQTYSNQSQVQYTHNAQGQLLSRTNRRGMTTTFSYLPNGLLSSKTYANGSQVTLTYDPHRNLQTVTTSAGTTQYTYDPSDRMTKQTNPDGTFLQYTYNAGGQRTRLIDSSGFVTNYAYDTAGRLSGLTDAGGAKIVSYSYDAAGRISTKTLGNGTSAGYTYDGAGNLSSITNRTATNAVLSEYDYTSDAEGQPVSVKSPAGNMTYGYDLDGQLTDVTTPAGSIKYTYDPAGNRSNVTANGTSSSYQVNNLNEYTSVNGSNYQYDADGNLISGNGWTYTYNDDNKLMTMVSANDSWSFQYDGLGNRFASTHNGKVVHYLIDPSGYGNVTAELDDRGAVIAHYTYGLGLVSSVQASGLTGYYHFDAVGNTTQITNAAGAIANSYVYLPFGEQTVLSAAIPNPFTFSGQAGIRDDGTGLYFMRNRWYNPQLGRFQQQDPIGLEGGLNSYEYVGNTPLVAIDPTGTESASPDYYSFNGGFLIVGGISVNAHTGEVYLSIGVATGGGANFSEGRILNPTDAQRANPGDAVNNLLTGLGYNAGVYAGNGGGVTGNSQGDAATEDGNGFGFHAGSATYGVSTTSTFVQHVWSDANDFTGGRLFGTDPASPFGPRVPAPPLPGVQPIIPCRGCLFKPGQKTPTKVQGSIDPNSKLTSGFGDQGYVPSGVPITYTIYFENQPTATLPAQKVVVTDALASTLDWSTVQLNQINFNNVTLTVPDGTQTYSAQANVSTDPNPVSVVAALNPATGVLTWTMQSVDAITGSTPANPLSGFLPPDNSASAGVGFVTFSVMPKKSLANATSITNQASIVFDVNAAINTNVVTNTLDLSAPTSAVNPLPASTTGSSILVSWTGSDPSGSGIASYNIYVSIDGGPYGLWLSGTTLTSYSYSVYPGHTFSFVSMATDNVGTPQTTPAAAQTVAAISNGLATPSVTVTPASASLSAAQSLSVGIVVASTSTPTGTVVLSSGTYTSAATALVAGKATIVVPAGALATGTDTLTATYIPDTAGATLFNTATGMANVMVAAPTVQVTIGASPAGVAFSVDGTSYTSAQVLTWTIGSTHTLATSSPQTASGTQQTFTAWSDGGALSHTVTATTGTTAYTATFSTAYLLTVAATPAVGGTVTPATGTYYAAGTVVNLVATPAAGYTFGSWTGAVANTSSASTTVTVNAPQTVTANFSVVVTPVVSVSPMSLTFTSTTGVIAAAQNVVVKNTGNGPLAISGISISGTGASSFAQTNSCGTSLAAGSSCNIAVTFTPSSVASFSASVLIAGNLSGSPQTVSLTGTGTAIVAPVVAVSPASLTFTSMTGVVTAAQSVTVSNTGNGPLAISGVTIGGAGAASFAQTNTCGASLAAGSSCSIAVTFTPSSVASFSATVSIADNASGAPHTASLTGTGTATPTFTLGATPASQDVVAGTSAAYAVSVTPQGGSFTGAVALSVTGLPSGATATFSPASVTPGAAGAQSTLTILTPTTFAGLRETGAPVLALTGCMLLAVRKRKRLVLYCLLLFGSLAGVAGLTGCGSSPHTATYTVTITGTSGTQTQSTTVKLTLH